MRAILVSIETSLEDCTVQPVSKTSCRRKKAPYRRLYIRKTGTSSGKEEILKEFSIARLIAQVVRTAFTVRTYVLTEYTMAEQIIQEAVHSDSPRHYMDGLRFSQFSRRKRWYDNVSISGTEECSGVRIERRKRKKYEETGF